MFSIYKLQRFTDITTTEQQLEVNGNTNCLSDRITCRIDEYLIEYVEILLYWV